MSAAATSSATTTPSAAPASLVPPAKEVDVTAQVDPGFYGVLVSVFMFVLTIFVLFSTGSILAVLVLWAMIALVITVLVYYGILSIDKLLGSVVTEVKKDEPIPEPAVPVAPGGPMVGSEVFHISDQQFTYDEANAVCAAYGAEMATLEQIMDSYAKGAEWCGYGWSAGGMALYPTQKATWQQLQSEVDPGKRTRCGRPGVNGGYFDPSIKFGVNCYGFKPQGKFTPPAPIPGSDTKKFREMVDKFKNMLKSFTLDPYSRQEWSGYDGTIGKQTYDYSKKIVEGFMGQRQGYGTQFTQDLGKLVENFGEGDPNYVEPITGAGAATTARPLQAPYGIMGDKGDKGELGPKGATGTGGAGGPQGPMGERGLTGPQGIQGVKGDQGDKGEKGEMGLRGAPGTGSAGGIGPTGDKGDKGEKGDKGDLGPQGPVGGVGKTGPEGPQGTSGAQGAPGYMDGTQTWKLNHLWDHGLRDDRQMYLRGNNNKYLSYGGGGGRGDWEKLNAEFV